MTFYNLLVSTLEIILYKVVQQNIGLYSLIEDTFFTSGIKVPEIQFIDMYISEVSKNLSTSVVTSSPMVGHAF